MESPWGEVLKVRRSIRMLLQDYRFLREKVAEYPEDEEFKMALEVTKEEIRERRKSWSAKKIMP
jgi:hypothetical protein